MVNSSQPNKKIKKKKKVSRLYRRGFVPVVFAFPLNKFLYSYIIIIKNKNKNPPFGPMPKLCKAQAY